METRGVWITTTASQVLYSQQNIAEAMDFLAQTGFNVVFPVVWNNAATVYPSKVMRDNFGLEIDPRFVGRDPLGELVVEARRVGLAVIPWFEYGFASSYNRNGGLLLSKKPEWAARDRSGNLLSKNNFEWMNALDAEVQNFILSLVLEVARNYEVTGIQGDDRLPALPSTGGYDSKTVERYRQQFNSPPPQNSQEAQWLQWRADILTDFLTRLYQEVIAVNPNLAISMAPSPYAWGYQEYLQDAQTWIDRGLVDLIHPQLYRRDFQSYKQMVDKLIAEQFTTEQLHALVPGVLLSEGSYRMNPDYLLQAIAYNRSVGIQGEVFFFYEGLRQDNNALANVLKAGPYARTAPFDLATIKQRSFTSRRIGGKYSYLDKAGKRVSQPQFDWADSLSEGLARVKMGYKFGYIDNAGKLVSRLQFDSADSVSEGLARISIGNKYGYLDKTGKIIIQRQFDGAESFSEGLAAVRSGDKWGYIDTTGKLVIQQQFDGAESFSEGLAAVRSGDKWGYIDKTGKLALQFQFNRVKSFSEGLAAVRSGDKWGYIDKIGKLVIQKQFDEAEPFSEGLAAVKSVAKWRYIDKTGKVTIPFEFDNAKPFSSGLALVLTGGKWGYIRNVTR